MSQRTPEPEARRWNLLRERETPDVGFSVASLGRKSACPARPPFAAATSASAPRPRKSAGGGFADDHMRAAAALRAIEAPIGGADERVDRRPVPREARDARAEGDEEGLAALALETHRPELVEHTRQDPRGSHR